jgi:hypothetical protein
VSRPSITDAALRRLHAAGALLVEVDHAERDDQAVIASLRDLVRAGVVDADGHGVALADQADARALPRGEGGGE